MISADEPIPSHFTRRTLMQAWMITMVSGLFFFYEFILLNMFNTLTPHLMRDFGVDAKTISVISSYYFNAEICLLLIAGMIIDRISTKRIILTAMTVSVICTVCFALSTSINVAILCRAIQGLGAAFCFMCSLKLAADWLPAKHVALASGLLVTQAMMGGVIAQEPLSYLITYTGGWRPAILNVAGLGVCIIIAIALIVQDKPARERTKELTLSDLKEQIIEAAKNRQNWLSGIYTCLVNLPIFLFGALFGVLYLTQTHGMTADQASIISSMVFWGTIFGSPFYGWLSDRIAKRRSPMLLGAALSLINILLIMYLHHPSYAVLVTLFFSLGFITSSQIITYPLITESNPKAITGTSLGIASTIIMSGGAIFQPLFGYLVQAGWDGTIINGISIYSTSDYRRALMIMPVAFIVSFIIALGIKETYCNHVD